MADLQALFHNPESFTDADLSTVKTTLRMQRLFPWAFAGGLGGAAYMMSLGHKQIYARTAVGAVAGLALGGYLAYTMLPRSQYHMYSDQARDTMDKDIITAFEQRYVDLSLNACGYGNNALTHAQNGQYADARIKKPY